MPLTSLREVTEASLQMALLLLGIILQLESLTKVPTADQVEVHRMVVAAAATSLVDRATVPGKTENTYPVRQMHA